MAVNLQTFPQLGAFPDEVGSGLDPGGINNSAMFPMNLPLNYWWNFSKRRQSRKQRRRQSRKRSRRSRKIKYTKKNIKRKNGYKRKL
jgi:hypothetical protein